MKCECTMTQDLLGDGCAICNPTMHAEILRDRLQQLEAFIDSQDLRDVYEVYLDEEE